MKATNEQRVISFTPLRINIQPSKSVSGLGMHDWQRVFHYHKELEFVLVDSGTLICGINKDSFKIYDGDILFFSSNTPHYTFTDKSSCKRSYIQFSESDFSSPKSTSSINLFIKSFDEPYRVFKNNTEENLALKECLQNIFSEYEMKLPFCESFIHADIYKLLALLYRYNVIVNASSDTYKNELKKIMPSVKYVEDNYRSKITLEEAAHAASLSPYYFCRLFKKVTNSTFNDFVSFFKIGKAEALLSQTSLSVADIAYEVGFTSASYLNYVFKKLKGISPLQFRKITRQFSDS